jgi:hypothetical protein
LWVPTVFLENGCARANLDSKKFLKDPIEIYPHF